jgi:hypothetical protein
MTRELRPCASKVRPARHKANVRTNAFSTLIDDLTLNESNCVDFDHRLRMAEHRDRHLRAGRVRPLEVLAPEFDKPRQVANIGLIHRRSNDLVVARSCRFQNPIEVGEHLFHLFVAVVRAGHVAIVVNPKLT